MSEFKIGQLVEPTWKIVDVYKSKHRDMVICCECTVCGHKKKFKPSEIRRGARECSNCARLENPSKYAPRDSIELCKDGFPSTTGASGELEGLKFSKLDVLVDVTSDFPPHTGTRYLCQCDCGERLIVKGYSLNNGKVRECGYCHFKHRRKVD